MSSQKRGNEGHYFIVVDGVPPQCQWQELKDYLRESAKVNPAGYADVLHVHGDGTRVGYCGLRNKSDADKAFDFLVAEGWRGLNIRVTISWKEDLRSEKLERQRGPQASLRKRIPVNTSAPALLSSNQYTARLPVLTEPCVPFDMDSIRHRLPSNKTCCPRHLPHPHVTRDPRNLFDTQDPSCKHPTLSRTSIDWLPVLSESRPQVGTSERFEDRVYTDQVSIHMSRLPHAIKASDLKALLSQFGTVIDVFVKCSKEKRCSATAKYASASQAALAVQTLNGKRLEKMSIVVRYDRCEVGSASSAPSTMSRGSNDGDSYSPRSFTATTKVLYSRNGPLVVDGARGPGYGRRRGHGDEIGGDIGRSEEEAHNTVKKTAARNSGSSKITTFDKK